MKAHIVTGLPGCGKSTVAKMISDSNSALIINTDEVRQMLYGLGSAYDGGDFTKEQVVTVYGAVAIAARYLFSSNPGIRHVVFDGSFRKAKQRKLIEDLAIKHEINISVIYVFADDAIVKERITKRFNEMTQAANFDTYLNLKKVYEIPLSAYKINNSSDISTLRNMVDLYLSE